MNTDLSHWLEVVWDQENFTIPNNTKNITKELIIKAAVEKTCFYKALGYLGSNSGTQFVRKLFPDRPKNQTIRTFLLRKINKKYCPKCNSVLDFNSFGFNSTTEDKLGNECRECEKCRHKEYYSRNIGDFLARAKLYKHSKSSRVPSWLSKEQLDEIKKIYRNRPKNYHVDHIIPLNGELVSGLHVPWNLQYLSPEKNLAKGNKFDV